MESDSEKTSKTTIKSLKIFKQLLSCKTNIYEYIGIYLKKY